MTPREKRIKNLCLQDHLLAMTVDRARPRLAAGPSGVVACVAGSTAVVAVQVGSWGREEHADGGAGERERCVRMRHADETRSASGVSE